MEKTIIKKNLAEIDAKLTEIIDGLRFYHVNDNLAKTLCGVRLVISASADMYLKTK